MAIDGLCASSEILADILQVKVAKLYAGKGGRYKGATSRTLCLLPPILAFMHAKLDTFHCRTHEPPFGALQS